MFECQKQIEHFEMRKLRKNTYVRTFIRNEKVAYVVSGVRFVHTKLNETDFDIATHSPGI